MNRLRSPVLGSGSFVHRSAHRPTRAREINFSLIELTEEQVTLLEVAHAEKTFVSYRGYSVHLTYYRAVLYDPFREWATGAHLVRIGIAGECPKWSLILTADSPDRRIEVVGPDDPRAVSNRGDDVAEEFYRSLLAATYGVMDTAKQRWWRLAGEV